MDIISASNLTKSYIRYNYKNKRAFGLLSRVKEEVKAIDALNLQISRGDIVGYVGINGAGKSTSIKLFSGIFAPTSGEVRVLGMDPFRNRRRLAQRYCVIFGQRSQLWWDIPVIKTYELLREIYNIPYNHYKKNLDMFIEILEMQKIIKTPVRNLSLGQRMRAEFAAAFLHNPEIALLDEATIGLDVIAKEKIRDFLKEINNDRQTTILLASHDLNDVEELCSKLILMDAGKKIYHGDIKGIKDKYEDRRYITVEYDSINPNIKLKSNRIDFEEANENTLTFSFNSKAISLREVTNELLADDSVKDFHIKEPNLEYIVKKVYENGNNKSN